MGIHVKNISFALCVTCLAVLLVLLLQYPLSSNWWYLVVSFSAIPFKVGRKTYVSVFGGFVDGNLYSLCGIYQEATGCTAQLFGVCSVQRAGERVDHFFGFALLQIGHEVWQVLGVAGVQIGHSVTQAVGVAGYQHASDSAFQGIGAVVMQYSKIYAGQLCGLTLTRHAGMTSDQMIGSSLVTFATEVKPTSLSVTPLQLAPVLSAVRHDP